MDFPALGTSPALDDILANAQVNGFGGHQNPNEPMAEFYTQIVMWNPDVFPLNPEQWSHALRVSVYPNGQVAGTLIGNNNNIDIQAASVNNGDGTATITIPFVVIGM